MNWILFTVVGILVAVGLLVWAFVHITRRAADAAAAIASVEEHQIHTLVDECIRVCDQKLGTGLDLNNLDGSAENLDFLLEPKQRMRTKAAFETPTHTGHFVLPLGAFLGELIRTHNAGARWIPRKGGGLAMDIPHGGITLTMHPFDKVLKHAATGKEGELLTYINVAAGRTDPP